MGIDKLPFISANCIMNAISVALRQYPGLTTDLLHRYPIIKLLQNAFDSNILGSGSLARFIMILKADFPEFHPENLSYPQQLSPLSGIRANFLVNHGYNPMIFNAWL